jgi:hypothetical protein
MYPGPVKALDNLSLQLYEQQRRLLHACDIAIPVAIERGEEYAVFLLENTRDQIVIDSNIVYIALSPQAQSRTAAGYNADSVMVDVVLRYAVETAHLMSDDPTTYPTHASKQITTESLPGNQLYDRVTGNLLFGVVNGELRHC